MTSKLLAAAALALPLAMLGASAAQERGVVKVQLLAINDLHGHLQPPSGANGRINSTEAGGVEYLATHLERDIAENPNSIIVAAGDLIGASPLVAGLFHDEPVIESLNALHLGVSSVGNHEFDDGLDEILRMKRGGCHPKDGCQDGDGFRGAAFQYLSANVVRTATRTPLFPAAAIRTVGGVKVGFIGETFRNTSQIVPPAVRQNLTFLDEAATANAYAAWLKRQGVHAIVLLIHEGGRQHPEESSAADPNGCAAFNGGLEPVVKKLTADIPVVISGHSHTFYNCRMGGHLVTSASSFGRMITRITLDIDRATGGVTSASATNQIVTHDVPKNPAQTRIIDKYTALVRQTAGKVVGAVTADLTRDANAAGENPLGDVIADAQLAGTSESGRGGAAVAFMNRGGVRADLVAAAHDAAAKPGEVTYGDLYSVQPFGNLLTVITMTGDAIKRLLEQQFDNPSDGATKIMLVSNGFTYRFRRNAPRGQHIDADSIAIGGRRVAPADRIRVAASDFMIDGGDGFTVFAEGTDRTASITDVDALVDYFKAHSPVAPPPQNRLVRTDQ